jgi:hypothetical protein
VFGQAIGRDVITNFGVHDKIDVSALELAGMNPTVQDAAPGLIISFTNGGSIQLLGVHPASLASTATGFSHI